VLAAAAFPGSTSALIDVGLLDASKMRRVVLIGRLAMARFEDGVNGGLWIRPVRQGLDVPPLPPEDGTLTFDAATQFIDMVESAAKGEGWTQLEANWPDALRTELQQFIVACQNPRLARVEMDDAMAIMRALEAGARSMREGGRTLNVPQAARAAIGESESAIGITYL
jgi:predicted dehydrogenase